MGRPIYHDPRDMHDRHAERLVLKGLLHDPAEVAAGLRDRKFTKADFYFDAHQRAYDLFMYVVNGGAAEPMLAAFEEMRRRRWWLDLASSSEAAYFLADVFLTDGWMADMVKWADMGYTGEQPFCCWSALAAAAKVAHLSARRQAVYAANELIRDSLHPAGDADWLRDRINAVEDEW